MQEKTVCSCGEGWYRVYREKVGFVPVGSCGCEFVVSLEEVNSCRKVPVLPVALLAEGREANLKTMQASSVLFH